MSTSIGPYRNIAQQEGARVVLDKAQNPKVQSETAFEFEQTIEFLNPFQIVGDTIDVHNRMALLNFANALRGHFGSAGDEAFALTLQEKFKSGEPLTPQDVRLTLNIATHRRDVWIADTTHTETSRLTLAIDRAIENADYPDPARAEFYKEALRTKLTEIGTDILRADATARKTLLTKVASEMAQQLDSIVLNGLGTYAEQNRLLVYPETASQSDIIDHAQGHGGLAANVPNFQHQIDTKLGHLGNNVKETVGRAMADIDAIDTRFFNGDGATGLTDIKITDSDPHHGGRQVMILSFNRDGPGENKIVYKPRDIRIDQRLTDRTGADGLNRSLAEIVSGHVGYALPQNTFLSRQDEADHHYGYMGFLPSGTVEDNVMTHGEAQQYYRDLGAQLAMLAFAGVTDLHHTNIRNSGGRPHFSDLEIAMKGSAFDTLREVLDGTKQPEALLGKMDATNIFQSSDQMVTQPMYKVTDGVMQIVHTNRTDAVTENLIGVANLGVVRSNFDNPPVMRAYANEFRQGFVDVLNAVRDHGEVYSGFITGLGNSDPPLHIRYHPIATTNNLTAINIHERESMSDPHNVMGKLTIGFGVDSQQAARSSGLPVDRLQNIYLNDWSIGDVPYFVRELGTDRLLHNTETELFRDNANTAYFNDNPILQSLDCIRMMDRHRLATVDIDAIGDGMRNWVQTRGNIDGKMEEHTAIVG